MNKITAVVVTYNRLEKLKKCVDSILNQDCPCDIIVVDNDSNDGTGEWVTDFIFAPEKSEIQETDTAKNGVCKSVSDTSESGIQNPESDLAENNSFVKEHSSENPDTYHEDDFVGEFKQEAFSVPEPKACYTENFEEHSDVETKDNSDLLSESEIEASDESTSENISDNNDPDTNSDGNDIDELTKEKIAAVLFNDENDVDSVNAEDSIDGEINNNSSDKQGVTDENNKDFADSKTAADLTAADFDAEANKKITNMTGVIISKTGPCKITYFNTGANLGGAGGFNAGMKYAYAQGYEYVWIMDDDAYPETTALAELMNADKILGGSENYGYIGSVVLWTDGSECVMNRHGNPKRYYFYTDLMQYGIVSAESSTFVSLLIPARTMEKVGLPIKEYFIWGDDIEYTTRITQVYKMPAFIAGKSIVIHDMKSNVGSDISRDDIARLKNYSYAFRNENHSYRHRGAKGFIRYIMRCGINFLRIIAHAKDHRMKRLGVFFSAVFKGFAFNPKIEYLESNNAECEEALTNNDSQSDNISN